MNVQMMRLLNRRVAHWLSTGAFLLLAVSPVQALVVVNSGDFAAGDDLTSAVAGVSINVERSGDGFVTRGQRFATPVFAASDDAGNLDTRWRSSSLFRIDFDQLTDFVSISFTQTVSHSLDSDSVGVLEVYGTDDGLLGTVSTTALDENILTATTAAIDLAGSNIAYARAFGDSSFGGAASVTAFAFEGPGAGDEIPEPTTLLLLLLGLTGFSLRAVRQQIG